MTEPALDANLGALATIASLLGTAVDAHQLDHRFGRSGEPCDGDALLRAAQGIGLLARRVRSRWERLPRVSLPALAEMSDGRFHVLARAATDKVLLQRAGERTPQLVARDDFCAAWSGRLILLTSRERLARNDGRFGIAWFIPSLVKYRHLFGEVLLASFVLQVLALVSPLFFQVVIDKVLVHRGVSTLDVLMVGLVAVALFEALLGGLRTHLFSHTTNRVDVELGTRLFQHALSLPLAYYGARRVGDTVARIRELENVRAFLTGSALTSAIDLVFGIVFFAVMAWYSLTLTLIALATVPLYVGLSLLATPLLRRRFDEKFARGAENQAFLVEAVTGIETLKAMAVEPQVQRRWERQLAAYVHAAFRASNLASWAGQSVSLVNRIAQTACLWVGAHLAMAGTLTVGELVAFNMLLGQVSGPVLRMAQLWQDFQQTRISIARMADVLDAPAEPTPGADHAAPPPIVGRVTFERVAFRYRLDGARVLDDVSLDVPAGQMLGIVGPSGSGKSTIARLAQRLHGPEGGRVLVDGIDLARADPAWLRRQIGVVLQESTLFNASVRDNIALADPGASAERVQRAAQLAGAHDFVLELPQGYDTIIGERGATLSGGQRQRIAIARALLTDPRILIFDEATSALDYESERIVQDNLRAIGRGRTVIVIAHRLATVRDADRIVTIEHGRIVEDGSHDELLHRGGRYAALYRHQLGLAHVRSG
jgi:subfamily B ATP-binding cassette protein HlyB/CyaB